MPSLHFDDRKSRADELAVRFATSSGPHVVLPIGTLFGCVVFWIKGKLIQSLPLMIHRTLHQIYLLVAGGKGARQGHKDITRFFDSFRIDH